MIIYPDGIYVSTMDYSSLAVRYNFIGMDNQTSPYFIVLMALTFYYAYLSKNKLTTMNKIDIFVSIVSIIYFWSATAVVGLAMFLMFMWLHVYNPKLANIKTGYKMVSILFIVIIIFNGQKIFSPFFEFVLNKDVTFSGRTQIWESAIAMISESPIIGKGIQESPNLVYFPRMLDFRTAHNEFLQIIIHGGLVSIGLLLYQLRLVQKRLYANWRNGSVVASLSSGIIAMLIMMLSESYGQMLCFYVLIFIAYYTLRVPNNN
jgi:Lipid A core - O-antigen ligase and related enzymes